MALPQDMKTNVQEQTTITYFEFNMYSQNEREHNTST